MSKSSTCERFCRMRGSLEGRRIAIDCANGATSGIAPALFKSLGFDVIVIGGDAQWAKYQS